MQKYIVSGLSLLIAIVAFVIALRVYLRSRSMKSYFKQSRDHWDQIKKTIPGEGFRLGTINGPKLGFSIMKISTGEGEFILYGNEREVSDLFASALRNNKTLRDFVKSSFRKSNKALE